METFILGTILVLIAVVYFISRKNTDMTERNFALINRHTKKIIWVLARHARSIEHPLSPFVWCLYHEADRQGAAQNELEQSVHEGQIVIRQIEVHDPRHPGHTTRGEELYRRLETDISIPPIKTSEQLLSRVYTPPGQGDKLTAFDPFGSMRVERTHNTPPASSSLSDSGPNIILSDDLLEDEEPTK